MTCDELINLAFSHSQKYAPEDLYDFRADDDLMTYLHTHYPEAYDFLHLPGLTLAEDPVGIAAVGVEPRLTLYLNPHKLTFMKQTSGLLHLDEFYKTFACLILHEEMHYVLRHFRFPQAAYKHDLLNIAQDMVIDNRIHIQNPGWRNWQHKIDEINCAIDEQHRTLAKLSADPNDPHFVLNFSDIDIYFYLDELNLARNPQDPPQFDEHPWNDEPKAGSGSHAAEHAGGHTQETLGNHTADNQTPSERGNSPENSGNTPADRQTGQAPKKSAPPDTKAPANPPDYDTILGELVKAARDRASQNEGRPWLNKNEQIMDRTLQIVAKGKEHNLFALLKRFIKKISYKQRTLTWKKISRKQPCIKPGTIYKKMPGEVLILIDTSGSMHAFIKKHIADTMNGIYTAFAQVARNYGLPSKMYKSDFAEQVLNFNKIKSVEELRNVTLFPGGGTSLSAAFSAVVDPWRKLTKSTQKAPDFILIITDFGDDYTFLKGNKYSALANKIMWLSTDPHTAFRPPVGIVVDVLADDWSTSIR